MGDERAEQAAGQEAAGGDHAFEPQVGLQLGKTVVTTLVGFNTRIAAKIAAYTYTFLVRRHLGQAQGRIKDL